MNNQLCAQSTSGAGSCHGDSGGPMSYEQGLFRFYFLKIRFIYSFVLIDGLRYVYGIISFGIGCGSNYPLVYTKVNKFLDWLETEMLNLE